MMFDKGAHGSTVMRTMLQPVQLIMKNQGVLFPVVIVPANVKAIHEEKLERKSDLPRPDF